MRAALVQMLAVARDLKVAHGDLAAIDTQRHNLLELLIRLFAERLLAAVRRGLPRRYILHEEDLAVLRGTLDVKRQFTSLVVRPDLVASRFDELSEDTPLNRVCKAAVTRLAGVTCLLENHRRLMELLARLDNVGDLDVSSAGTGRSGSHQHRIPRCLSPRSTVSDGRLARHDEWEDIGVFAPVPHERPVRRVRRQDRSNNALGTGRVQLQDQSRKALEIRKRVGLSIPCALTWWSTYPSHPSGSRREMEALANRPMGRARTM